MLTRVLTIVLATGVVLVAAHDNIGTWKLDTSRSKYEGMLKPKETTVTYTPQGSGWRYEAKGIRGDGQTIDSSFTYVKDGDEIKTTGFPYWDALVLTNAASDVATGTLKRDGKVIGTVKRSYSGDGKTMTIRGELTTPDGKKAKYTAVYNKQ